MQNQRSAFQRGLPGVCAGAREHTSTGFARFPIQFARRVLPCGASERDRFRFDPGRSRRLHVGQLVRETVLADEHIKHRLTRPAVLRALASGRPAALQCLQS